MFVDNRIYWIDAKNDKIESIDTDGNDRRLILSEDKTHYFGISLSGPYLYFTDWTKKYVLLLVPKSLFTSVNVNV